MLSKLVLQLEADNDINAFSGAVFHGLIMDLISSGDADYLHEQNRNPFSQYLRRKEGRLYWTIYGLNAYAYENIIKKLLAVNEIKLKQKDKKLHILDIKLNRFPRKQFIAESLFPDDNYLFPISFLTPTAFKSNGEYYFFPDIRLIFQSLMNKIESTGDEQVFDLEVLNMLADSLKIDRYYLASKYFSVKGNRISSFSGAIRLKLYKNFDLYGMINMLLKFGEFSGVGIKTSMGMGAIGLGRETV